MYEPQHHRFLFQTGLKAKINDRVLKIIRIVDTGEIQITLIIQAFSKLKFQL